MMDIILRFAKVDSIGGDFQQANGATDYRAPRFVGTLRHQRPRLGAIPGIHKATLKWSDIPQCRLPMGSCKPLAD
ncbi:MAG: hypothetical protein QG662_1477 [Pseudomonadota bacterium]|nr:hypothetical protein [Pseudomonadota bacterium]